MTRALRALPSRLVADRRLRFLAAGVINTAFAFIFYPALLWLVPWMHIHYLVALAIAQTTNIAFSFTTQKLLVFADSNGNMAREFATFLSFNLGVIALNWVTLPAMVELAKINASVSQVIFTIVATIGSYVWHSSVTFRSNTQKATGDK